MTSDPDRLIRFTREARLLASLNHPRIGAIHGLEDIAGTPALVLELVEGGTLAERLARGRLPVADTLSIATQLADALEAAHEKGIVHRDLKPANIKITPEGIVKVLDFGIAKATGRSETGAEPSQTETTLAGTRDGAILGTAAYMSPEQARAQAVDTRTDIWALGCVLFEMLTGRPAFEGGSVAEILGEVQKSEPEWPLLPADTPDASDVCSGAACARMPGPACGTSATPASRSRRHRARPRAQQRRVPLLAEAPARLQPSAQVS